jgi:hypothetical protein
MINAIIAACGLAVSHGETPEAILSRARHVLGMDGPNASVLVVTSREATAQAFQSDRMYPPYMTLIDDHRTWIDASTGVARDSVTGSFGQSLLTISDDRSAWSERGASWAAAEIERGLDPRLLVHAWSASPDQGRVRHQARSR